MINYDELRAKYQRLGIETPTFDMIKSEKDIEGIRKAGIVNNMVLDEVEKHIKAGMSTEEINTIVHNKTIELGGIPAPLNFEGYPKSVCTSINDAVCHGIPSKKDILKNGDIVFARTGATVGKSYLIEKLSVESIYASYLIRIRTSQQLNPK